MGTFQQIASDFSDEWVPWLTPGPTLRPRCRHRLTELGLPKFRSASLEETTLSTDSPVRPRRVPGRPRSSAPSALTPHLMRVVLGGPGLADLPVGDCTDHYVKLQFPEGERAVQRAYTVRSYDAASHELTIDFVVHGDEGVAGPGRWRARPATRSAWSARAVATHRPTDVDWHLFVGDESALPAIAASLERVADRPPRRRVRRGRGRRRGAAADQPGHPRGHLGAPIRRVACGPGEELVDRVTTATLPRGDFDAFVHGEAGFVREVRRHLRGERGPRAGRLSASGYWRRGRTDEDWRAEKKDWKRAVQDDDAALETELTARSELSSGRPSTGDRHGRRGHPPPEEYVARLREIVAGLPEIREEDAWRGVRWRVGSTTVAHTLVVVDGTPASYARAAGLDGPATVLTFHAAGDELVFYRRGRTAVLLAAVVAHHRRHGPRRRHRLERGRRGGHRELPHLRAGATQRSAPAFRVPDRW